MKNTILYIANILFQLGSNLQEVIILEKDNVKIYPLKSLLFNKKKSFSLVLQKISRGEFSRNLLSFTESHFNTGVNKSNLRLYSFFSLFYLLPLSVFSQAEAEVARRIYVTKSIGEIAPPEIDGAIDEVSWEVVEWTSDYTEFEPDNGSLPVYQTKMKIVYDTRNLYVAFHALHPYPDQIVKRLTRRDGTEGDLVNIILASYNDQRTAFSFSVTAAGVKSDKFISNNGNNWDSSWNSIWEAKTRIDSLGWTAEMRIPLSQIRFGNEEEQVWGLQSARRDFHNAEQSFWQHIPVNAPGFVSNFGELRGIKGLQPQKQLEIQPYALTKYNSYPRETSNPFRDGSDLSFTAGVDAKIGITNDLTLDLTVNPDFGQVDADPGAIALDGFEIFFEERRPFFVENKNIFNYYLGGNQDNLFFSRRIGRSPQGSVFGPAVAFVDQPQSTTILGAAKFSGKTKDGWSIGILESATVKEYAQVVNEDGSRGITLVEPLTNYFAGRLQKDFNKNNSYIGGIFTTTHRDLEDNLSFLHREAYTGGLDFQHNWKNRKYFLEGTMSLSHVIGKEEAITATQRSIVHLFQRVDATHVDVDSTRTSLTGTGGQLTFGKTGGKWRYNTGGNWRSPELELNDIGFLRQADDINQFFKIERIFNEPTNWYRIADLNFEQSSAFDFEGNYNRLKYEIEGNINYKNNWRMKIGGAHKPRIFLNTFLRGGPRWRFSEENFAYLFIGTDDREKFSIVTGYINSQTVQNNFSLDRYELGFNYTPFDALNLFLNTEYEERPNKTQYVTQMNFNGEKRYITGAIEQQTLRATLRVDYTINPDITIQYYGQPFISKGSYSNFNYVTSSTAENLYERVAFYNDNQISLANQSYSVDEDLDGITDYSFRKPDFAFAQFRSNLVLRWEYLPGSEIFFVWSQGITGAGDGEDNFNTIIDNQFLNKKPENTFLVKVTYRFLR